MADIEVVLATLAKEGKNASWTSVCWKCNCSKEELSMAISAIFTGSPIACRACKQLLTENESKRREKTMSKNQNQNQQTKKNQQTQAQPQQPQKAQTPAVKPTSSKAQTPSQKVDEMLAELAGNVTELKETKVLVIEKIKEVDATIKELDDIKGKMGGMKKQLEEFQRNITKQENGYLKLEKELVALRETTVKPIVVEVSIENDTYTAKDGAVISTDGHEKVFKSLRSNTAIDDKYNGRELKITSNMKAILANAKDATVSFVFVDGAKATQERITSLVNKD